MNISLQRTFYGLVVLVGIFAFLHYGRPVLVSVAIALLLSFILYPLCTRLENLGFSRILAALSVLVGTVLLSFGSIYLFSTQIISFMSEFSDFGNKLTFLADEIVKFINNKVPLVSDIDREDLIERSQQLIKEVSGQLMSGTLNSTANFISGFLMVMIYTFLILIYRTGLVKVAVQTAAKGKERKRARAMIRDMQKVGQQYLVGMSIMIVILGVANSTALLLLGIDHAILFGFLASFLALIPYVGTTLGATIPTLYAFMTHDSMLVPMGVVLAFWFIQLVESNFLSPKIVGGNLNINALAAILALIVGGYLWGIAGMTLSLPFTAIFRVYCSYVRSLRPISTLLGSELYEKQKPTDIHQIRSELTKVITRDKSKPAEKSSIRLEKKTGSTKSAADTKNAAET